MIVMPKLTVRGFTLVELLVVMSIVAILATLGMTIYSTVLKNSRDSKRQADLATHIQPALEQYFADQLYYPVLGTGSCPATPSVDDGKFRMGCALRNSGGTKTYSQSLPADPITSNYPPYQYVPSPADCNNPANCTSYCLYAKMENKTSLLAACADQTSGSVTYDFELTVP